jgi:predicted peroxiredoxin
VVAQAPAPRDFGLCLAGRGAGAPPTFIAASGAIEAGHEPEIALLGDATYLVKNGVAEHLHGVGCAPLVDLWPKLIEHRTPAYV